MLEMSLFQQMVQLSKIMARKSKILSSVLTVATFGLFSVFFAWLEEVRAEPAPSATCQACIDRKSQLCADECEDVAVNRALGCQRRCFEDYCAHRCEKGAPEFVSCEFPSCESCPKRQFDLCEPHCVTGDPEEKNQCKNQCANERCRHICQPRSESSSKGKAAKDPVETR